MLRRRRLVLATVAAITVAAGWQASTIGFDSSIEVWFLDGDPNLVGYNEFLERFEADEITVMAAFADDVFTPTTLAAIDRMTRAAQNAPYVHRVRSLTNVNVARGSDGVVEIVPLIDALPQTTQAAADIRARALANSTLDGMVSPDGKAAAIVVEMSPEGQDFDRKIEMVRALDAIAAAESMEVRIAGSPPLDDAFLRYSERDFTLFGPFTMLFVIALIYVIFRRFSAVMVPLAVVVLSLVWLFGLMAVLGKKLDVVSSGLPAVILAVGVADTIHVLSDYYGELRRGRDRHEAVVESITALLVPCFFTSITTAAGMLSLLVSDLQPVRQFGWQAACGVTIAFALSVTLAPVLLLHTRPPDPEFIRRQADGYLSRVVGWLGAPGPRRARATAALSLGILVLSLWSIGRLEVGANAMNYFKEGDPVRVATERIDEALGGTASVELVLKTADEGLKEPAVLANVEALEDRIRERPGVTHALSVVGSLKEMNRVMTTGESPGVFALPDSRPLTAQMYLLLEGEEDFETAVQDNYSVGRITARVQLSRSSELIGQLPDLEADLDEFRSRGMEIDLTGYVKLMGDMEVYLLDSQTRSFIAAFGVITLMMLLLLRSWSLALFAMIPNFMPVLMGLAFMSAVGIPLDPGTVMIGSIALGLVVDDTVHFLVRLRRHLQADSDMTQAIVHTLEEAGRPIIITSMALVGGFLVLVGASFTPNIHFGLVTAVVVALALVADLVMLPAVLLLIRPKV